jgi:hypothetical protein
MDPPSIGTVGNCIAFETVTSVEEFGDVSADIVTQDKSTAWVVLEVRGEINNHVFEECVLLATCNFLFELLTGHFRLDFRERVSL